MRYGIMKLSKLEKKFVNSKKQAEKNIEIAEQLFSQIDLNNIKKALEVGCGIGVLASYLAKKYKWDFIGIDLDSEQVERARNDNIKYENLKFFEADVTNLPFVNSEFDMVLSFDVLHHIPCWDRALDEISRVLKPNGFYIFNDLAFSKLRLLKRLLKNYMAFYAMDDIINHLKRNNFEIVYKLKPVIIFKHYNIVFRKIV